MSIATYYLTSHVFEKMVSNENFKGKTIKEIINNNSHNLRDDSEIENYDDFILTLEALTYWDVDELPRIIYNYVNKNLHITYSFSEFILERYIKYIEIYRRFKKC